MKNINEGEKGGVVGEIISMCELGARRETEKLGRNATALAFPAQSRRVVRRSLTRSLLKQEWED